MRGDPKYIFKYNLAKGTVKAQQEQKEQKEHSLESFTGLLPKTNLSRDPKKDFFLFFERERERVDGGIREQGCQTREFVEIR